MRLREHAGIIPGRIDIMYCKPQELTVEEGYNVRDLTTSEARSELDELKAQVKEHGVLTPLKVRFNGTDIIIVEGHRRRTVALELIAEYEASGGTRGRNIEAVPIFPEAPGTTAIDRDAGLEISNSGTRLKPLERGNLIYRMHTVHGLPLEAVAKRLAISMAVLRNCLEMRAMPEDVKEQVQAGDVSPSLAVKFVREHPEEAAAMLRANKEENKRLGVGSRIKNKVTPKTLKRDHPKMKPEAAAERLLYREEESLVLGVLRAGTELVPEQAPLTQAGAEPAREVAPPAAPAPDNSVDLTLILIELTKQSRLILNHNKDGDNPGYWTMDFEAAIKRAERELASAGVTIGHEFESSPSDPFELVDEAIDDMKTAAEAEHV